MKHPLSKGASHYDKGNREVIFDIEDELTIGELIGACKFNILKYEKRQDHKGQKESDLQKINDYKEYLKFLEKFEHPMLLKSTASKVYELYEITFN